jgi:hypothetical protein
MLNSKNRQIYAITKMKFGGLRGSGCNYDVIQCFLCLSFPVFSAAVPKFRCRIPGCDVANGTYQDAFEKHFNTFTIPVTEAETAQCRQFK